MQENNKKQWGREILSRIRQCRIQQNITQEQMAERLHLSLNAYARIERGESQLYVERLVQMAQVLQIDLVKLIYPPNKIDFLNYKSALVTHDNACEHCQALREELERTQQLLQTLIENLESFNQNVSK